VVPSRTPHRSGSRRRAGKSRANENRDHNSRKTLVWIDDYQPGLKAYKNIFEAFGYSVLTASSGRLGLRLLDAHPADAVVVDYEMPEMDGGQVALEIRRKRGDLPIVMFSGSTTVPAHIRGLVNAFCDKAGSPTLLMSAIEHLVSNSTSLPTRNT